jgi:hypothetical protein
MLKLTLKLICVVSAQFLIMILSDRKIGRGVMFSVWIKWVKTTSVYVLRKTNIVYLLLYLMQLQIPSFCIH